MRGTKTWVLSPRLWGANVRGEPRNAARLHEGDTAQRGPHTRRLRGRWRCTGRLYRPQVGRHGGEQRLARAAAKTMSENKLGGIGKRQQSTHARGQSQPSNASSWGASGAAAAAPATRARCGGASGCASNAANPSPKPSPPASKPPANADCASASPRVAAGAPAGPGCGLLGSRCAWGGDACFFANANSAAFFSAASASTTSFWSRHTSPKATLSEASQYPALDWVGGRRVFASEIRAVSVSPLARACVQIRRHSRLRSNQRVGRMEMCTQHDRLYCTAGEKKIE